MEPNPVTRCQHLLTSGAQCGSPALRDQKYCYYHQQNRPQPPEPNVEGESSAEPQLLIPLLEDAYSIQVVIRQVMQLLVQKKTDPKTAGLLLYALQIASSNLARMDDEEPQPEDVVVDLDKVAETPLETDFFDEEIPDPPQEPPPPPPPQIVNESVEIVIYPGFEPSLITVDRLRAAIVILQKGVADHEAKMQASDKSKMPKSKKFAMQMPEDPAMQTPEDPATQTPEKPATQTPEDPAIQTSQDSASADSNDGLPQGTIQARARMPQRGRKSDERPGYVN